MTTHETLERLKREAFAGDLPNASQQTLEEYSAALCHSQAFSFFADREYPQVCETVRTHLLRSHIEKLQGHVVELHDHITKLNASNSKIQCWVIVLAIASLIGTAAQVWFAAKADRTPGEKSIAIESQQQTPTAQSVVPSFNQGKKKTP